MESLVPNGRKIVNSKHNETYRTNLVGSLWIVDPICCIYVLTYSPNYISLVIYLSTYQLPKLIYLLPYLSTTQNSIFTCSLLYQLHTLAYLLTSCFQVHYNNLFTHLLIYLPTIAYLRIYLSIYLLSTTLH
jgi:hypothetical protein